MNFNIMQGDNRDTLKSLSDNSVDAIVTDPPYGIDFLGKSWDANTGALETYKECLRVLKPGGYILAFSAARTYHHLAVTLEQAGFEIRDQLMWLYASGFPKAQDIGKAIQRRQGVEKTETRILDASGGYQNNAVGGGLKENTQVETEINEVVPTSPEAKQWSGWKTALKPAHEPICMARKPFKGSTIDNVLEVGVGALNIDASRVGDEILSYDSNIEKGMYNGAGYKYGNNADKTANNILTQTQGRFPSNVLGEVEGYQKYFYCPKVSRKERHCGFEQKDIPTFSGGMYDNHGTGVMYSRGTDMKSKKNDPLDHLGRQNFNTGYHSEDPKRKQKQDAQEDKILKNWEMVRAMGGHYITEDGKPILEDGDFGNQAEIPGYGWINLNGIKSVYADWCKKNNVNANHGNNHPTVKPVALMRYLIKLVTPPNSTVLDPFTGSGSTGMAAVELGHTFIGCELDPNYVKIAETRITAWNTTEESAQFDALFEVIDK